MRTSPLAALAASLTLLVPVAATAAPLSDPVESGRYAFERALKLPAPNLDASPLQQTGGGLREGGLSGLQVVPGTRNRRFLSVTDRGPNGQPDAATGGRTFLTPGFSPTVYELEAQPDGSLATVSRMQLRVPGVDPLRADPLIGGAADLITGLRNVTTTNLDDRIYFHTGASTIQEYLPTDPYGLDTEGVQRDPRDGSYWISDEYRPSIAHFSPSGVMLSRIMPVGSGQLPTSQGTLGQAYNGAAQPTLQELLPAEYKARRSNRGMEGLTLDATGTTLYGIMQNPLDTRGYPTQGYGAQCSGSSDVGAGATNPNSTNYWRDVRIVKFDVSDPAEPVLTGEYVYRLESISTTDSAAQGKARISDLAWVGKDQLVVDEHDDDAAGHANRALWTADLSGATNILTATGVTPSDRMTPTTIGTKTQRLGCFLDNGSTDELTALNVTPAAKTKYLDLSPAGVNFEFNKVEGIAPLEGLDGVAVVNDNDFGFTQDTTDNTVDIPKPPASPAEELRIYAARPAGTAPTVTGTAKAGRTLTCTPGTYGGTGALDVTYAWLRGGTVVGTGATYTLSTDDVGQTLTCRVTAARVYGAVRAPATAQTSAPTPTVADFDTGAAGATGAQGPKGDTGAAGTKGDKGDAGTNGAKGDTGKKGAKGDRGPRGRRGPRGKRARMRAARSLGRMAGRRAG